MQWKQKQRDLMIALALNIILISFPWQIASPASIFINEIHYDNIRGDTGEGVEIAGPAGTD